MFMLGIKKPRLTQPPGFTTHHRGPVTHPIFRHRAKDTTFAMPPAAWQPAMVGNPADTRLVRHIFGSETQPSRPLVLEWSGYSVKIPSSNPSVNLAWQGLHNWLQDVAIRMVIHDYMILGKCEKLTKMCGVNHQTVDALDPSCGKLQG